MASSTPHIIVDQSLTARRYKPEQRLHVAELERIVGLIEDDLKNHEDHCRLYERDDAFQPHFHNSIFIHGERGSGKTTLLLNIRDALRKRKVRGKPRIFPPIDPTLYQNGRTFLFAILAQLHRNRGDEATNSCPNEKLDSLFYHARALIDTHSERSSHEVYRSIQSEGDLENCVSAYIDEYCNQEKVKILYLPIDDNDMAADNCFHVLDTIRRYLTSPRIVPIITGSFELYHIHIQNAMTELLTGQRDRTSLEVLMKLHEIETEGIVRETLTGRYKTIVRRDLDQLIGSRRIYTQTVDAYLSKILPDHRRIVLPSSLGSNDRQERSSLIRFSYSGHKESQAAHLDLVSKVVFRALFWGEQTGKIADQYGLEFFQGRTTRDLIHFLRAVKSGLEFFFEDRSHEDVETLAQDYRLSDEFQYLIRDLLPFLEIGNIPEFNGQLMRDTLKELNLFFSHETLGGALTYESEKQEIHDFSDEGFGFGLTLPIGTNHKDGKRKEHLQKLAVLATTLVHENIGSKFSALRFFANVLSTQNRSEFRLGCDARNWLFFESDSKDFFEHDTGDSNTSKVKEVWQIIAIPKSHRSNFDTSSWKPIDMEFLEGYEMGDLGNLNLVDYALMSPRAMNYLKGVAKRMQNFVEDATLESPANLPEILSTGFGILSEGDDLLEVQRSLRAHLPDLLNIIVERVVGSRILADQVEIFSVFPNDLEHIQLEIRDLTRGLRNQLLVATTRAAGDSDAFFKKRFPRPRILSNTSTKQLGEFLRKLPKSEFDTLQDLVEESASAREFFANLLHIPKEKANTGYLRQLLDKKK